MKQSSLFAAVLAALAVTGCSSDSDPSSPAPSQLTGVASQGGAIQGYLSTQSAAVSKQFAAPATMAAASPQNSDIIKDGLFALDLQSLTLPTLVKISGTNAGDDVELYSVVLDKQNLHLNLSPFTRLLISMVTGVDASEVYNNPAQYQQQLTADNFADAQAELNQVLAPLLDAAGFDQSVNLLNAETQPNYQGLDGVLSLLDVVFEEDSATISVAISDSHDNATLSYGQGWNRNLIGDYQHQQLSLLADANELLESMILLNPTVDPQAVEFKKLLSEDAVWFGAIGRDAVAANFHNGAPNEQSEMDRYRDLEITAVNGDRYLVAFTERFEAGEFASAGRQQAWFAYQGEQLKFIGDNYQLPTSANAFFKAYWFENGYDWSGSESFSWALEVDAFIDIAQCTDELANGEWDWSADNSEFAAGLTTVNEHFGAEFQGLNHIEVFGPGLPRASAPKLDRIFKDPQLGGCHLVATRDDGSVYSPMMDGIYLGPDQLQAIADADEIAYTMAFMDDQGNQLATKVITLSKGPSPQVEITRDLMAHKQYISGEPNNFRYDWSRANPFVVESDLWVYFTGHQGAGTRVALEDGKTEVSLTDNEAIERVFHAAFDPYGRVLSDSYVKRWDSDYLTDTQAQQ